MANTANSEEILKEQKGLNFGQNFKIGAESNLFKQPADLPEPASKDKCEFDKKFKK